MNMKKKALQQYLQAKRNGLILQATCVGINHREWEEMMTGAVKANGSKIRSLIKLHLPDLYYALALEFRNPYEHQSKRKGDMLIYVHSGIEYFLNIK